jgi:2-amino-4-hydroxy-6-hydroxymethyldihydropteridine diphosphokinase
MSTSFRTAHPKTAFSYFSDKPLRCLEKYEGDGQSVRGIYIGLGSNLGDRLENLNKAIEALPPRIHKVTASLVYETDPWGYLDQPAFLNQVIEVETGLLPLDLLASLKQIERKLGRQASFRNGPRLIDLDIIVYGDWILDQDGLVIPHPRMHERAFVLKPLADLAPDLCHPVYNTAIQDLLSNVDQTGVHLYKS